MHSLPHTENLAEQNLRQQGFATYLPRRQRTVRHARRIRIVSSAYFEAYFFVSFDIGKRSWYPINSTVGVRNLVTTGSAPVPVPQGIVEALMSATDEQGILHPLDLLQPGGTVRVVDGVFAGQLGRLDSVGTSGAVRILLDIMNRAVSVKIDRQNIIVVS
ncbi:transcription termination/antitermination protein NusG [Nitratireductor sp. ZSWI3]|uniref:transcription termination/antitermination protein NusG n=1 Tax=Nitratireductor sp. ZSWI3 TaxID=2966359 RepID=UPI00214FA49E|nr:transcription termination/antitermination NusG family protein [Nitratireductor sp. ZSWI3]MCR4267835.1 transcription antiterminator NusG [Nitratireductor sp. ZSWI3]